MSTDLHVTTAQNYAHTQDVLEGLRAKLRDIENRQARARSDADLAESNRAHLLARAGGIATNKEYKAQLPKFESERKTHEDRLKALADEHAKVKAEVDRLEGNPTLDSTPRSTAEQENQAALKVVNAVTEGKPLDEVEIDPRVIKAPTPPITPLDDPTKSYGTIQAALKVANNKEVERSIRNVVQNAPDKEASAEAVRTGAEKAVDKALKAPKFGEALKQETERVTTSYPAPKVEPSTEPSAFEPVDIYAEAPIESGVVDQSISGLVESAKVPAAKKTPKAKKE